MPDKCMVYSLCIADESSVWPTFPMGNVMFAFLECKLRRLYFPV